MNNKKKFIVKLFGILVFLFPNVVLAEEYIKCGKNNYYFPLNIVNLASAFFSIMKIFVPIIFVIGGMVSFLKVTFSSNVADDLKKAKSKLINSIIAAVIIFFAVSIVRFAVGLVAGASNSFMDCVDCFISPEKCEHENHEEDEEDDGFIKGLDTSKEKPTNNNSPEYNIETIDGVTYVDGTLIVNKTYSIPASYKPKSDSNTTIQSDCVYASCLTKETEEAFNSMQTVAAKDGISLWIVSGYRNYYFQVTLYNNYLNAHGREKADTFSARAGHSEHQTGLAIDLNNASDGFIGTAEANWLNNYCWKYGFILRYPEGKDSVTGYKYEPWHMRYVGEELAKKLYNNGDWITLEEYYGLTSKYSN